jgi:peptide methionine sulfoxide reductase MsrB
MGSMAWAGPAAHSQQWPTDWASIDTARAIVSGDASAAILRCEACGRECDTYSGAHESADDAVREFLQHCAFDHISGAPFAVMTVTRVISWER